MPTKLLQKLNSIQALSPAGEALLLSVIKRTAVAKNQILLPEGKTCTHIYYIETGCLKAFTYNDSKEVNLAFAVDDDLITNLKSLRNGSPAESCITACEPSVIWSFARADLLALYKQSEEISNLGRNLLEQLLIDQEQHANLFKLKTPQERYAYVQTCSPLLIQKVSQTQLASYLGISRETLSRIRRLI